MSRDLYQEIYNHYNVEPDRRGWVHVDCPFCGAEANARKPNFSFNDKGWNCYSCEGNGHIGKKNLISLARKLGLWSDEPGHRSPSITPPVRSAPRPAPRPEPAWKKDPEAWVESYLHHPQRYKLWMAHKPVSRETIDKHQFGVGHLPDQKMTRLIVPLFWKGQIVGLKGRKLTDENPDIPKWIAAEGSNVTTLWGFNFIPQNPSVLWICENYVDAALLTQMTGYPAVATGGARELTAEEISSLRRIKPNQIILAYDNDLAGQAMGSFRTSLEEQWMQEQKEKHPTHTRVKPPHSRAFPLAETLKNAGLMTYLFPWPEDAPAKADLMWALEQV